MNDIIIDGQIRFGAPCIKGTRISVSDILGYIAGGGTVETILENFPELTKENIYDAVSYASHVVSIGAKIPPLHEATVG